MMLENVLPSGNLFPPPPGLKDHVLTPHFGGWELQVINSEETPAEQTAVIIVHGERVGGSCGELAGRKTGGT
jgi:hypothetical protein